MKTINIKLSKTEIEFLLEAIEDNKKLGLYIGDGGEYWQIAEKVRLKLETIKNENNQTINQ